MSKRKMTAFFVLYFLFAIAVNLVHPVTVKYVDTLKLPDSYFGFLFSLMSLGQVVGSIIFGHLSDRIGRKWLVIIGLLGYCLSQIGFGFINTEPIIILLFRFFAGVFVSAPSTLFVSLCIDYSSSKQKAKMLTIASSFYILGSSLSYEISGLLFDYLEFTISEIFIFQAIFTVITSLLFMVLIKDVKKEKIQKENVNNNSLKIKPIVYMLLLGLAVLTISQILINKYLDTYVLHLNYNTSVLGHYVFISGCASAIVNLLIIPIIKKIKDKRLEKLLLSFILMSAILTFVTFFSKVNIIAMLFSSHMIYIIIKGLITPLEQNELASYCNENNTGKLTGIRQTIISIGNVLGPLIGSAVYTKGSPLIFAVAATIMFVSLGIYILYFILKKKSNI